MKTDYPLIRLPRGSFNPGQSDAATLAKYYAAGPTQAPKTSVRRSYTRLDSTRQNQRHIIKSHIVIVNRSLSAPPLKTSRKEFYAKIHQAPAPKCQAPAPVPLFQEEGKKGVVKAVNTLQTIEKIIARLTIIATEHAPICPSHAKHGATRQNIVSHSSSPAHLISSKPAFEHSPTSPIKPIPLTPKSPPAELSPINSPVLSPSSIHGLLQMSDFDLTSSAALLPEAAKKPTQSRSAFKTHTSFRKALQTALDPKAPPAQLIPAAVLSPITAKAGAAPTAQPLVSAPGKSAASAAVKLNKFQSLPEPLLFMLADSLLTGKDGLKEVTRLFTRVAHQKTDPIKNKQSTLEVIYRFINRANVNYAYTILEIAEFKIENIPEIWKAALQNSKAISLHGIQSPAQVKDIANFFPRLETLELYKCTLDTESLAAIGNLQELQELKVSNCNGINDTNIASINGCRALSSLTISWCERGLSDAGIKTLFLLKPDGNPSGLKKLNLNGNRQLTDEALVHITKTFPKLEMLHLGACILITAKGFTHVPALTELRSLNLEFCKGLFKDGLNTLVRIKKLETLILKRFEFQDNFPSLILLNNLKHLDLRYSSKLTDTILSRISPIAPKLSYFSLFKAKGFSQEVFTNLLRITRLDLQQSSSPIPCDKPSEADDK